MKGEYLSLESAENLHKSKKAQADNTKLKTDNELYKHLYEIELKRNKELQEENDILKRDIEAMKHNYNLLVRLIENGESMTQKFIKGLQGEDKGGEE